MSYIDQARPEITTRRCGASPTPLLGLLDNIIEILALAQLNRRASGLIVVIEHLVRFGKGPESAAELAADAARAEANGFPMASLANIANAPALRLCWSQDAVRRETAGRTALLAAQTSTMLASASGSQLCHFWCYQQPSKGRHSRHLIPRNLTIFDPNHPSEQLSGLAHGLGGCNWSSWSRAGSTSCATRASSSAAAPF